MKRLPSIFVKWPKTRSELDLDQAKRNIEDAEIACQLHKIKAHHILNTLSKKQGILKIERL